MLILLKFLYKNNKNIHEVWTHLRWKLVEIPIKSWQFKRKASMLSHTDSFIYFWEWRAAQKCPVWDCCSLDPPSPPPFSPFLPLSRDDYWRDWDRQVTDCRRLFSGKKQKLFMETLISDISHLKHNLLVASYLLDLPFLSSIWYQLIM